MSLASHGIITGDVADFLVLVLKFLKIQLFFISFFGEEPVKLIQEQLRNVGGKYWFNDLSPVVTL